MGALSQDVIMILHTRLIRHHKPHRHVEQRINDVIKWNERVQRVLRQFFDWRWNCRDICYVCE